MVAFAVYLIVMVLCIKCAVACPGHSMQWWAHFGGRRGIGGQLCRFKQSEKLTWCQVQVQVLTWCQAKS
jgi:hypothetical protein